MDARITKSRLGNFLSYDWLKIIVAIVFAVLGLSVFFTTVRTRPRSDQVYEIYGYLGLKQGSVTLDFDKTLEEADVFSYDILETRLESFDGYDNYSGSAFAARRAAGQGDVMFLSDYAVYDEEGNETQASSLKSYVSGLFVEEEGTERMSGVHDFRTFLSDCETYLKNAFGDDLTAAAEPKEEVVRTLFTERNGKDKRFRSAAKKEEGVRLEAERLKKLKEDFLAVEAAIEGGKYSFTDYTTEKGNTYTPSLAVGKLGRIQELFYYPVETEGETKLSGETLNVILFDNGRRESDLRFETVSFLAYLLGAFDA